MRASRRIVFFIVLFSSALPHCHAAMSSSSYQMEAEISGTSGEAITSSSYQIPVSAVDWIEGAAINSTNFGIESKSEALNAKPDAVIQSVNPEDLAGFYTDEAAGFTVSAISPDGDSLNYQASQDGSLKDGPQASNTLSWALGAGALGRHEVQLQVIDSEGTVSKDQSIYVFRRPLK